MVNLSPFYHHNAVIYHPVVFCIDAPPFESESSGNHPMAAGNHPHHQPTANRFEIAVNSTYPNPSPFYHPGAGIHHHALGKPSFSCRFMAGNFGERRIPLGDRLRHSGSEAG
jgi:hypothetical protein